MSVVLICCKPVNNFYTANVLHIPLFHCHQYREGGITTIWNYITTIGDMGTL
jgi:hypothetical protein